MPRSWEDLSNAHGIVEDNSPSGDFAFLADPVGLLSAKQRADLRDGLNELAKLRREVESDGANLALSQLMRPNT